MEKYLPLLKRAPLFKGLSEQETLAILGCLRGRLQEYHKNDFLLRSGEATESAGLLLSGSVLILQEDFWGNRNLLTHIQPGRLFAESYACSPGAVLNVSVQADSDSTVLWLNIHRILETCPTACSHHSHMIRNMLSDLASNNLQLNEKLTHVGKRTTKEKLLSYLSEEAKRQGASEFDIYFNRQQLADYLSVERSAMSAELGKLRDEGVLRFEKNHFALLAE